MGLVVTNNIIYLSILIMTTTSNMTKNDYLIIFLTLFILGLDLVLPVEVTVNAAYALVVLTCLWSAKRSYIYWTTIICAWLSLVGLLLSDTSSAEMIINTLIAITIIIATGFLVFNSKTTMKNIASLNILSTTDETSLAKNRTAFNEIAPIELVRAKRYNRNLSIAIINIDQFDRIFSKEGRENSNNYLKCFVSTIRSMVRKSDCIYRLGEMEFAILFVETDMIHVVAVVEEIGKKIASTPLTEKNLVTTISVGVDCCESNDNIDTLLMRARIAVKKSKALGGNKVSTVQEFAADSIRVG